MNQDMNREVREASEAGIRALNSLRRAQQHLDGARGWGVLDLLGGGVISSLLKHSRMDEARQCVEQAQRDLETFRRELEDVALPDVRVDGLLTFADFFFDGLLADYLVQRRINEARAGIERACGQVEDILRRLRTA